MLSTGGISDHTLRCKDWYCVKIIQEYSEESTSLIRLRVWKIEDYALPEGKQPIWPPIIDETRA